MKKTTTASLSIAALFLSQAAFASNTAVVDTGTYFGHKLLRSQMWMNPNEMPGDSVDDDSNGKVDDYVGWNFNDSNATIFYPNHINEYHPLVFRAIQLIAKLQAGTITPEEKQEWNDKVISLPQDQKDKFIAQINSYGGYVHGTHTSGIVAMQNPQTKIMSSRVFPNDAVPEPHEPFSTFKLPFMPKFNKNQEAGDLFYMFAAQQGNKVFHDVSQYLRESSMDVGNYSLGMAMVNVVAQYFKLMGVENPTPEQTLAEVQAATPYFASEAQTWVTNSPQTLFAIAAGNDGTDNEIFPVYPANVIANNSITVAASQDRSALAKFSNWGNKTVNVAAPGVAVMSSVPWTTTTAMLPMSGTSMAAPFVAGVASKIKDINPSLSPVLMKKIIVGTVDKKEWLVGKVTSEGVVNELRCYRAAELAKTMRIDTAIDQANTEIAAIPETPVASFHESADPVLLDMAKVARKIVQ